MMRAGPGRHHEHPVAEQDRLLEAVGDEQHGAPVGLPQLEQLVLQDLAHLGVERGERLVHQQDLGLDGERPGDGDALLHAARQRAG